MACREATQDARHEVSSNYAPPRVSNFRFELLMNDSYRKIGTDSAVRINSVRSIHGMLFARCQRMCVYAFEIIIRIIRYFIYSNLICTENNFEFYLAYTIFMRNGYLIIIYKILYLCFEKK